MGFVMVIQELEAEAKILSPWTVAENKEKIRILCLSLWYPLSMSRYFEDAMRHNPNIDLKTVGVFTGSWIPWRGGITLDEKYSKPPDIPLPFRPDIGRVNYDFVKTQLPQNWTPDIVLCIDAGITWEHRPSDGFVAHIGTDPHVLSGWYEKSRKFSDLFFNMQLCYKEKQDIYLPYGYSPRVHYETKSTESQKDTDAVLIGMPYENRVRWVDELRKHGVSVIFENSPVFDEYRELANRASIGLNWSSMNDLNARFFETPAFGLAPVMNRVPDAHLFLDEGADYLAFNDLNAAMEAVFFLKDHNEDRERMAASAYKHIQGQTYDNRIEQVLRECGF